MTSLIELADKKIREIPNAQMREKCLKALENSVIWEGLEDSELPMCANEIMDVYAINAQLLFDNMILLDKRAVVQYLQELGLNLTQKALNKKLTRNKYKQHFEDDRAPIILGTKILVTYAEVRSFFDVRLHGEMPGDDKKAQAHRLKVVGGNSGANE